MKAKHEMRFVAVQALGSRPPYLALELQRHQIDRFVERQVEPVNSCCMSLAVVVAVVAAADTLPGDSGTALRQEKQGLQGIRKDLRCAAVDLDVGGQGKADYCHTIEGLSTGWGLP